MERIIHFCLQYITDKFCLLSKRKRTNFGWKNQVINFKASEFFKVNQIFQNNRLLSTKINERWLLCLKLFTDLKFEDFSTILETIKPTLCLLSPFGHIFKRITPCKSDIFIMNFEHLLAVGQELHPVLSCSSS